MGCFPAFVTTPSGFACHPSDGGEFSPPSSSFSFPSSGGVPRRGGVVIAICREKLLHEAFFMSLERGELLGLCGDQFVDG